MKIVANNIGALDLAEIEVEENKLNIFYGINGCGKSTLAYGISQKINKEDLSPLKRYGKDVMPLINIENCASDSVLTFDQTYIKEKLFKEDILNNSYEIVINSDKYQSEKGKVEQALQEIIYSIKQAELGKVKTILQEFIDNIKFTPKSKGNDIFLDSRGKFAKAMKLPELNTVLEGDALVYKSKLEGVNKNNWFTWFKAGNEFVNQNQCPFCMQSLPIKFDEIATKIISEYEKSTLKQNAEMEKVLLDMDKYLPSDSKEILKHGLLATSELSGDEKKNLFELSKKFAAEVQKIDNLLTLDAIKIKEIFENGKIINYLSENMLDLSVFTQLDETELIKIKEVNTKISETISNISGLSSIVTTFYENLNKTVKGNENYINEFFDISGIPYRIHIEENNVNSFKTILLPRDCDAFVSDTRLSFGEKNAISLMLFSLEAKSKKNSLIILDDPVSSFDRNKKYAILYYLFTKKNAVLAQRTVLFLTHDFEIVVDVKSKTDLKSLKANCYMLQNEHKTLRQYSISNNALQSSIIQWHKKATNESENMLLRVINLRKYLEFTDRSKQHSIDVLSSLEHLDSKAKSSNDIELSLEDRETGIKCIKEEFINSFDYNKILNDFSNLGMLFKWYKNCHNNIDKLQILREAIVKSGTVVQNNILYEYVTKYYHCGDNELCTLNESNNDYSTVPEYIILAADICMEKLYRNRN